MRNVTEHNRSVTSESQTESPLCHFVQQRLPDFLHRGLTAVDHQQIHAHLAQCDRCARRVQEARLLDDDLQAEADRYQPRLSRDASLRIQNQVYKRMQRSLVWQRTGQVVRLSTAVAALMLLLAGSFLFGRFSLGMDGILGIDPAYKMPVVWINPADKSRALADETRRAAEQLAALNRELLDEADRNAGNEEAIARRQYEDRIRQIEALALAAGREGAQAAAEAKRQAEENFKAELARIRARREEERKAHAERMEELGRERDARDASTSSSGGGINRPATSDPSLPSPLAPRGPLVAINLDGATIIGDPSPATLEKLAVPIGRILNQRAALRR